MNSAFLLINVNKQGSARTRLHASSCSFGSVRQLLARTAAEKRVNDCASSHAQRAKAIEDGGVMKAW